LALKSVWVFPEKYFEKKQLRLNIMKVSFSLTKFLRRFTMIPLTLCHFFSDKFKNILSTFKQTAIIWIRHFQYFQINISNRIENNNICFNWKGSCAPVCLSNWGQVCIVEKERKKRKNEYFTISQIFVWKRLHDASGWRMKKLFFKL
jgi:hypothetical protein